MPSAIHRAAPHRAVLAVYDLLAAAVVGRLEFWTADANAAALAGELGVAFGTRS